MHQRLQALAVHDTPANDRRPDRRLAQLQLPLPPLFRRLARPLRAKFERVALDNDKVGMIGRAQHALVRLGKGRVRGRRREPSKRLEDGEALFRVPAAGTVRRVAVGPLARDGRVDAVERVDELDGEI